MKFKNPDIDIDMKDRGDAERLLGGIAASIIKEGGVTKHNTGVYFTDIPTDPLTGQASLDHKVAEERGYFKIDFLNLGIYDDIGDEDHLDALIAREPNWVRLQLNSEFVSKLIHIGNYDDLLQSMKPESIEEMAMFLAVIRPGKKHLKYKSWHEVKQTIWIVDDTAGYVFKKSHATSYAMAVAVHMNLIEESE